MLKENNIEASENKKTSTLRFFVIHGEKNLLILTCYLDPKQTPGPRSKAQGVYLKSSSFNPGLNEAGV